MTLQAQLVWLKSAANTLPNAEGVSRALALVASGAPNDELFFGELKDAAWLPILERNGYFSRPLSDQADSDRRNNYRNRLPLFALARFSETSPFQATAILLRIPLATVRANADQVLHCLAKLRDRKAITSVAPLSVYLAETTHRATAVWIEDLLGAWIKAGAYTEAVGILRAFVGSTVNASIDEQPNIDRQWQLAEIDRKLVDDLAKFSPQKIAQIYFEALSRWAALRRAPAQIGDGTLLDGPVISDPARELPFCFWMQDFRQPPSGVRDLEETLATRLYATCAVECGSGDESKIAQIESLLRSDRWELFTRLRWQLYADYPESTLEFARREVLELLPHLGRIDYGHGFEFAQLLKRHAEKHGSAFLSSDEARKLVNVVFAGPVDEHGELELEADRSRFWRKQLQPLEALLTAADLQRIQLDRAVSLNDYKPFRMGEARMIEQVSPASVDALAAKSDSDLWQFLNSWKPSNRRETEEWWIEESVDALASTLAAVIERDPRRFSLVSKWWEKIERPEMLNRILDRAANRVSGREQKGVEVTETDLATWLALAECVAAHATKGKVHTDPNEDETQPVWSTLATARFLEALVSAKTSVSHEQRQKVVQLLRVVLQANDPRLSKKNSGIASDGLTTAINSARGIAMQAILDIAVQQHETEKALESWIFETIETRLLHPDESPALFALLGSRLRLLVVLFGDKFTPRPELLFPRDRPQHREAAVLAHFKYDNPMVGVIKTFPELIPAGLALAAEAAKGRKGPRSPSREFDSRLGVHIAFYHWNNSFPTDQAGDEVLDQFFALAASDTRGSVIDQIGSAFEKATEQSIPANVRNRVMQIWERRFGQIQEIAQRAASDSTEFQEELAAFTDWIRCECFPLEWRVRRVINALDLLTSGPRSYGLVKYIGEQHDKPERLQYMLQVLQALVRRPSDEVRWAMQEREVRPILERAFESQIPEVRIQAETTLELLLRQGFLTFLDIGKASGG